MSSLYDITSRIDPAGAEPYLRSQGWEVAHQGELGNRWRLRVGDRIRNVAVPLLRADEDDRSRMFASVLDVLADVERRDPLAIARDLSDAPYDLVEFRLIGEHLSHGEMPLRAAPELTRGAYEAVQAAARAELARRAHYAQGTLPTQVRAFVDKTVLAGTESGSVILRVRAPAAMPPKAQTEIDGVFESFERRAVVRLMGGVTAAKTAAHRDLAAAGEDIFEEDIDDGLSANLCDALLKLSGASTGLDARIALRIRWALTRPGPSPASQVDVEQSEVGQLPRVAEILKQIEPSPDTTVTGPVVQIRRQPGDPEGVVIINADVDSRVRQVRMHLELSDYEAAADAHIKQQEIRATGTLERAGTTRELINPTGLVAVPKPQP